ncbi:MAG: hypothetical protein ACQCN4_12770 [Candidatus Bathyarchaeia archaeon]
MTNDSAAENHVTQKANYHMRNLFTSRLFDGNSAADERNFVQPYNLR